MELTIEGWLSYGNQQLPVCASLDRADLVLDGCHARLLLSIFCSKLSAVLHYHFSLFIGLASMSSFGRSVLWLYSPLLVVVSSINLSEYTWRSEKYSAGSAIAIMC